MSKFEKIHKLIKSAKSAAIIGHIRPDGDCIGSCLAMRLAVLKLGYHTADVYIDGEVSSTFSYMEGAQDIISEPIGTDFSKQYDLMITLDCADEARLGAYTSLRKYCKNVICIDHHRDTSIEGDAVLFEPDKSSAGLMLYEYFTEYGIEITKDIATALYTSIASDTGCFLFSNTTADAHSAAAYLISKGINIEEINYSNFRVYDSKNIEALIYVLKNIKLFANKQIASIILPYGIIKKLKIDNDFRHRFQKYADDIDGVRASVCLSEREKGVYHVSLRSHGNVNVAAVAGYFGGGGHKNASGFQKKDNFKNLFKEIIEQLEKALKN